MSRRLLACLVACMAVVALLLGPAVHAQNPQVAKPSAEITVPPLRYQERTLPNGMKLVIAPDHSVPLVNVQIFYGVGSKDDPPGRSGFAHLFEHLMFKATRDMPDEYMDRLTDDVGGLNNASTWDDFTNYFDVVPSNHLERVLWAEAQRMSSLMVDDANFKSERAVVEEELRQRVLADPYGRFEGLAIPQNSFTAHPYKRPGIGSIADLEAASIADVRAFHATYYRPDNAMLIVAGDFDPAQLDAWVAKYFGPIAAPAMPLPRVTVKEPARTGPKIVTTYGPNVPLPAVAITWLGPAAADHDYAALTVLDTLLTGGDSARLNQALVYRHQIAQRVFSSADARQQPGLFYVGAIMAGGKIPADGEKALLAQIGRLRDAPVSAAELDKAKTMLVASQLRQRERVYGRGFAFGYAQYVEGAVSKVNDDISDIEVVTPADIQRVVKKYLAENRRVTINYVSDKNRPADAPAEPDPSVASAAKPSVAEPSATPAAQRQAPPEPGPPVTPSLPVASEKILANGLRVIVAHDGTLPLVTAQLTIKAGGAADPMGKAGLADFTASLLNQGAGGRSAAQIARGIEALGAQIDANASWDGSRVSLQAVTPRLGASMTPFADMVLKPTFAESDLEHLRARTLDSLAVDLQEPGNLARYAGAVAVFAGTPYGHVLDGTPASVKRFTRADVQAFHRTWYRPDNAVLVLTGDITPEQGFALAQQSFGAWKAPAAPLPDIAASAPQAKPRVIVIDLPGTGQAAVSLYIPSIARSDPRYYQLMTANTVLGGGYSARLNEEVRVKRGLSYGASAAMDARRGIGPIAASAQTENESAVEVAGLMLKEMAGLKSNPPAAAELDARKAALIGGFGRTVATGSGLAGYLSNLALQGIDLNEINRYAPTVQAVTADQVTAIAAAMLDPARATVVMVGDAKRFGGALNATYPNAEIIPAASLNLDSASLR